MTAAIEIKGLRKTYRAKKTGEEIVALHGVDLTIPRGSFFGSNSGSRFRFPNFVLARLLFAI